MINIHKWAISIASAKLLHGYWKWPNSKVREEPVSQSTNFSRVKTSMAMINCESHKLSLVKKATFGQLPLWSRAASGRLVGPPSADFCNLFIYVIYIYIYIYIYMYICIYYMHT